MDKPVNKTYIEPKPDTPEVRPMVCPECGEGKDILVGMGDTPNYCASCSHSWVSSVDSDKDVKPVISDLSESVIFKSPEILLTLNQKPIGFERRIDALIEAFRVENRYCTQCRQTIKHDIQLSSGKPSYTCQKCGSVKYPPKQANLVPAGDQDMKTWPELLRLATRRPVT
jgi:hypothetical protein